MKLKYLQSIFHSKIQFSTDVTIFLDAFSPPATIFYAQFTRSTSKYNYNYQT